MVMMRAQSLSAAGCVCVCLRTLLVSPCGCGQVMPAGLFVEYFVPWDVLC